MLFLLVVTDLLHQVNGILAMVHSSYTKIVSEKLSLVSWDNFTFCKEDMLKALYCPFNQGIYFVIALIIISWSSHKWHRS